MNTRKIAAFLATLALVSSCVLGNADNPFELAAGKYDPTTDWFGKPTSNLVDELDGFTIGAAHNIEFVEFPGGKGAAFSRSNDSRIVYSNNLVFPQGTIEFRVLVKKGFYYSNYIYFDDPGKALVFTTDIQGGDVTWPGSTWLYLHSNGYIRLSMATTQYGTAPSHEIEASNTVFRFNEWHWIGFSYGDKGQALMVDGNVVVSNSSNTQILGAGGDHYSVSDLPTFGESEPGFWSENRWEGGFEGIIDRIHISGFQMNWVQVD